MTVITKSSGTVKKPIIINAPLVEKNVKQISDEEKIEIESDWSKKSVHNMCCLWFTAVLMVFCGLVVGFLIYHQITHPSPVRRYQGFCSIPIPNDMRENFRIDTNYRVLPLRWSSDPGVQVVSTLNEQRGEDFVNALREELDIGDTLEKISVINNGHRVNFIHDFTDNTTGIVDLERCFIMDLQPEIVMSPELFIAGLEHGHEFDVSRVRSNLKAMLPAVQELSRQIAEQCFSRPVYRLNKEGSVGIRKRSADEPEHDYMQFSGKHVLEIKIDNLAEILDYEKKAEA